MKKVVILGSTGMLGHMVYNYFKNRFDYVNSCYDYDVIGSVRTENTQTGGTVVFDPLSSSTWGNLPLDADYIINCIGKIKPQMMKSLSDSIYINAVFPHVLASRCEGTQTKLIHITTDCVFSGANGNYIEADVHDAYDEYGKSKSLGEPKNCMVIRTSIIGTEIYNNSSLIAWVKSQTGNIIQGYDNHFWNGITTLQYARICDKIIKEDRYATGVYHVYSPSIVSKYELVNLINDTYSIGVKEIVKTTAPESIDRTLRSTKQLCESLYIPELEKQLQDMKAFGE